MVFIPMPQPQKPEGVTPKDPPTPEQEAEASHQKAIALVILSAIAGIFLVAALTVMLSRPARAQSAAQGASPQVAYLLIRGADTIIVERATRTRDAISGNIAARGSGSILYVAELAAGPAVPELTFRVLGPGAPIDAAPLQVGAMRIGADSAVIEAGPSGGTPQRAAVAVSGAPIPLINGSMSLANLMLARARASNERPYRGKFHFLQGAGVPLDATIEFNAGDSAVLTLNGQVHRLLLDANGRIAGGTIPSQGITIARVSGAAAAGISLGRPDYGAPAGAPYTAEEVTVRTPRGHSLSGTLTVPKGATGRVPAVVTITGSGQQDRDEHLPLVPDFRPFRQLADALGRRGIAVLRLDDRGVNGSGGDVAGATSADFADDIRAGVAFLRARPGIDPARVALVGHSEGGMIGPMVAASDPRIAAVVLMAGPAINGRQIIQFQLRNLVMGDSTIPAAKKDSAARANVAAWDSTAGRQPWTRFFLDYDPLATARRITQPVLILQGATDQQVTPEQAPMLEQALKSAGNRDVTMHVFPDRNHLFLPDPVGFPGNYSRLRHGRIGGDVMDPLVEWLVSRLNARTARP